MEAAMKYARALFALILATSGLLTLAVAPVLAGTQYAGSCSTSMNRWLAYENAIGDSSDGDDRLWLCNVGSLGGDNLDIDHNLAGICKAPAKINDNWNDCLSSFRVYIVDATRALCIYSGYGYGGTKSFKIVWSDAVASYRKNLADYNIASDTASSFRWIVYNGSC
jgi:hypothetical protein